MGIGSSFVCCNEDEEVDDGVKNGSSQGVVKRIPNEIKPRGRLGGLRSVRSLGRPIKGGSTRSALSIDMENPEVWYSSLCIHHEKTRYFIQLCELTSIC